LIELKKFPGLFQRTGNFIGLWQDFLYQRIIRTSAKQLIFDKKKSVICCNFLKICVCEDDFKTMLK
jgi:hypothetical protein